MQGIHFLEDIQMIYMDTKNWVNNLKITNFICARTAAEVPSHIFFFSNSVGASEYF